MEIDVGTGSELKLAMQMVQSPVIVDYMSNPADEFLSHLAFGEFRVFQDSFKSHRTFWISDFDLRYYSNMEFIYDLDKSDTGNAWYSASLNSGVPYQFYVDYDLGLKKTYMWINALVYDSQHRAVGIAGTGVELDEFVEDMYRHLEDGVTMYMYNASAEISGSLDLQHLENKVLITKVMPELLRAKTLFPKDDTFVSTCSVKALENGMHTISDGALAIAKHGVQLSDGFKRMSESVAGIGDEIGRFNV